MMNCKAWSATTLSMGLPGPTDDGRQRQRYHQYQYRRRCDGLQSRRWHGYCECSSTGKDNTLSLGHGIKYADLLFKKNVNDLVLVIGASEQVTFKDWYANVNKTTACRRCRW